MRTLADPSPATRDSLLPGFSSEVLPHRAWEEVRIALRGSGGAFGIVNCVIRFDKTPDQITPADIEAWIQERLDRNQSVETTTPTEPV